MRLECNLSASSNAYTTYCKYAKNGNVQVPLVVRTFSQCMLSMTQAVGEVISSAEACQ